MVVASQVLDFILVMRWNQALGIPDVLCLGAQGVALVFF